MTPPRSATRVSWASSTLRQCSNAPSDAGVADDRRLLGEVARVEEALSVDVREIDDARRSASHRPTSSRPNAVRPSSSRRPLAICREARLVGAEVREAQVANAPAREVIDLVEIALERVGALDAEERRDRPGGLGRGDVARGAGEPHRPRRADHRRLELSIWPSIAAASPRLRPTGIDTRPKNCEPSPPSRRRGTST